ncbi:carbohydrate kinase family protein [Candidatus Nomurabacteria bacterium]|nr:carbohydrate kinase family protein [Candidatus Nomurabacteria bacterium]
MEKDNKIDFLAIGDIATEPFIRITDAEASCDLQGEHCKICFRFGDKIPYESAEICKAVGNSPNVAVGASKLGINTSLISYVGDDLVGKQNIESLMKDGVNIDHMKIVPGMESNYHYVLWYANERTILVKHTEFPYSFGSDVPEAKWIYLSSLASNSTEYHKEIAEYLKKFPETKLAFQPGTFQIKLGVETLKDIYERTEILFCNIVEAKRILNTEEDDKSYLIKGLRDLGPKIVIMTDGLSGAYAYDGNDALYLPVYSTESFESTGAGDAFASAMISALILGKDLNEAFSWGPINSMSVVKK